MLAAPAVTLYNSTSNVYGRAYVGRDAGVVRFLGIQASTAECEAACLGYSGADGALCHSFSYHGPDFPTKSYAGACFAVADHSWDPVAPSDRITSGRVAWPSAPCGGGAPAGCEWQADPVCLSAGGDIFPTPQSLTPSEALARCAALDSCVGYTFTGLPNSTAPVAVSFKNRTSEVKGGGSNCWSYRKYFPLSADPYRTALHFQPSANWMNDPNGPMWYNGLCAPR
eukprot:6515347-Prymnesium_polylepis.1